jgi:transcriptional regulator with XRE-family HTH domain
MRVRLTEVRRARGWSQGKLHQRSGLSRSYISEIESGSHDPTTKTICKLCRALGCTPNDLIQCGEEQKEHDN